MTNLLDIHVESCRRRQQRLLEVMRERNLDLVVVDATEHVQWLTGVRCGWVFSPAAALRADGRCILVAPNEKPAVAAADEVVTYEAQWHCTLRNDQRQAASTALAKALGSATGTQRVGVEFSRFNHYLELPAQHELVDIEPTLYYLRRRKEADELARIRKVIEATRAMYAKAREIIEPGISELEVFNQLQAAAVASCGEMLTGTGNDYACGEKGGPPRDRRAQAGELYILDLGPAYRGYFADNCRAFSVDGKPTDEQLAAHAAILPVFDLVQRFVRPGARCRELFEQAQQLLDQHLPGAFDHHLGHGIGLFPHEAPHLNPHWDDVFEEGDVFTVEPGIYAPSLRAGIRLENNYRVTADGVELLSDIPLEL